MARNKVEVHIQDGALFTFKVKAGQTLKIGEVVEISGDEEVQRAGATSTKVIGIVYSGSVGIDGVNVGYKGDNGDVVTVVVMRPQVYIPVGATVTAGQVLKSDANGKVVPLVVGTDSDQARVGIALTGATSGNDAIVILG
ncbi:hypothetical protein CN367_11740 [Priestia megaterium]|uniref:capsid cement protein n=1 Tax=Priestia megaterium TaxID=1404 RepID=UPI000BF37255|nr:capsid cement protein [Priestia megaterium]PEZ47033.1 hypothetical protein CN367_11740 [Priestia megaterium]